MKIYVVNGSPRKNGNTAALCNKFLGGALSTGGQIEVEIIHLYDLQFTGCISCFGCKKKGGTYGRCIAKDDLHDVLQRLSQADGIALASPIYFGDITGQMRCFLERLLFPFNTYEAGYKTIAPKKMPIAMIYTMNVTEELMGKLHYDTHLAHMETVIGNIFTPPNRLFAFNTYQFNNYDNYKVEVFSEPEKAEYREMQFPIDCEKAFDAGKAMVQKAY